MRCESFPLKTSGLRSSASLCFVTSDDQRRVLSRRAAFFDFLLCEFMTVNSALGIGRWMLSVGRLAFIKKRARCAPLFFPFREPTPNFFVSQRSNLANSNFARRELCARIFFQRPGNSTAGMVHCQLVVQISNRITVGTARSPLPSQGRGEGEGLFSAAARGKFGTPHFSPLPSSKGRGAKKPRATCCELAKTFEVNSNRRCPCA